MIAIIIYRVKDPRVLVSYHRKTLKPLFWAHSSNNWEELINLLGDLTKAKYFSAI